MLTWTEIETRASAFQKNWRDCSGNEKQDDLKFIEQFLNIFGVDWQTGYPQHQIFMPNGTPNYIDYLLPGQILIEMKSKGKSLDSAHTQAMNYVQALKPEETPQLIMVCDFDQVRVFNYHKKHPYKPFKVSELRKYVRIFRLLAGYGGADEAKTEIELNTDASYKLARLHDALKEKNYVGHPLEVYLVRLLFCLFADDTGIFEKSTFRKYIEASDKDGSGLSERLMMLFSILDTPPENRMTNLSEELKRFRYIDGNLFSESLPPASFDAKMRSILLDCCDFDWTQISPAIFGAMFQGVMNPQERRELGAHYTSEENILKVIKPLFLDELEEEFERSVSTSAELRAFQDKLASLTFLDPACGSGNFLIITYQRLRELEFKVLKLLHSNLQYDFITDHTRVSLNQFYGIEIEDFPCEIAKVSMLLMKHLMDQEVSAYFGTNFIDFPIKDNANIVKGNALRLDWNEVVPAGKLDYIMGNPPFVGYGFQTDDQKREIQSIYIDEAGKTYSSSGKIDYVAAWFFKAAQLMNAYPKIKSCFVATNSVCQGDQVEPIWKPLYDRFNLEIIYAYQTFRWSNEAKSKAAVHCVIVGFSTSPISQPKTLFRNVSSSINNPEWEEIKCPSINFYLYPGPIFFITKRSTPICDVLPMITGNRPTDGGNLIIDGSEYESFLIREPEAYKYIKRFMGSREFLHNEMRYCLWLVGASPKEINALPMVKERIRLVKETREESSDAGARKLANRPMEFRETINPPNAIVVPLTSSENRKYIPMGFIDDSVIVSNALCIIPDGKTFEFGVLISSTHMAWMRTVAGRLKSDYRYSKDIVYNNFPWPNPTPAQKEKIEQTAQAILDARERYPEASLADLYDELTMPPDLRKAHQANDKAVWEAYGKVWPLDDEPACVAWLMSKYVTLITSHN